MRCLYHTFVPSQTLAVQFEAPSLQPEALQCQYTASSEEGVPTRGSLGQAPAVQGPPSPAEAQPPLTFATGPPGEPWAGSRRQLPPPLALMSSSGFGNFQSSQECLLKCSRRREQKEQNGALCPPSACKKQSAITQTGWLHRAKEMDVAFWNLYHPKGKCLLNHRKPGESRGGRCRDLMTLQRQGHKGGTATRHWTSSCHHCQGHPSSGKVPGGGREAWRCLPDLDTHQRCMHMCAHTQTHSHAHVRSH